MTVQEVDAVDLEIFVLQSTDMRILSIFYFCKIGVC